MKKFIFIMLASLLFISCKTLQETKIVEKEVPVIETRIEYRDKLVYDSIYVRDSIYTFIKGDTLIKYKEKTNTRYIYKTDTIVKVDSIPVVTTITEKVTEVKEVNKLYTWQKGLMTIGGVAILALILFLIVKLKKLYNYV